MTDNPNIAPDLIQTVYFDVTNQQFVDLVSPFTKLGFYTRKTRNELAMECNAEIVEMDRSEARRLQDAKYITPVEETTFVYFNEMLNVLPPCQWRAGYDFEHFYLSGRVSGSIVLYLVRAGDRYLKFQDRSGMSSAEIRSRVDAFLTPATMNQPQ